MTDQTRIIQIERDALIIAGGKAYMDLSTQYHWATKAWGDDADAMSRIESSRESSEAFRNMIYSHQTLTLGCMEAFNSAAWMGDAGILAQYRTSKWRGHRCGAEDIEALVWGCAGRLACTIYRGDQVVALLGLDEDERTINFSSSHEDPLMTAEIIWRAADLGAELAASMKRDDEVTHPAVAVWRAEQAEQPKSVLDDPGLDKPDAGWIDPLERFRDEKAAGPEQSDAPKVDPS